MAHCILDTFATCLTADSIKYLHKIHIEESDGRSWKIPQESSLLSSSILG